MTTENFENVYAQIYQQKALLIDGHNTLDLNYFFIITQDNSVHVQHFSIYIYTRTNLITVNTYTSRKDMIRDQD
jgi:hypothetical protein